MQNPIVADYADYAVHASHVDAHTSCYSSDWAADSAATSSLLPTAAASAANPRGIPYCSDHTPFHAYTPTTAATSATYMNGKLFQTKGSMTFIRGTSTKRRFRASFSL